MKKVFKFLCGVASMAAIGFGAYCVYKNVFAKKEEEDFDDFDDCFEEEADGDATENREYVSINITEEAADAEDGDAEKAAEETVSETVEE